MEALERKSKRVPFDRIKGMYAKVRLHKGYLVSADPSHLLKVPQQPNHCDCGVFLLHYVERFVENCEVNFTNLVVGSVPFSESH